MQYEETGMVHQAASSPRAAS